MNLFDPEGLAGLGEGTEINFAAGLPGFAEAHRFKLEDLGPNLRPFSRLRSVGGTEIAFIVVPPGLLYPDYSVEIVNDDQAALGIESAEDVVTLVLITTPKAPQSPTANLLGPIVVNKRTGAAMQIVQHKSDYAVAEPLPAA